MPIPPEVNRQAVKRYRLRMSAKARAYEAMLEVLRIHLESLSWRDPTPDDVLELLEHLAIAAQAPELIDRILKLRQKKQ